MFIYLFRLLSPSQSGCSSWPLASHGCSWFLLAPPCPHGSSWSSWLLLGRQNKSIESTCFFAYWLLLVLTAPPGSFWLLTGTPGLSLAPPGSPWLHAPPGSSLGLVPPSSPWLILTPPGSSWLSPDSKDLSPFSKETAICERQASKMSATLLMPTA